MQPLGGSCRTILVKLAGLNRLASCLMHGQTRIDARGPISQSPTCVLIYRRLLECKNTDVP